MFWSRRSLLVDSRTKRVTRSGWRRGDLFSYSSRLDGKLRRARWNPYPPHRGPMLISTWTRRVHRDCRCQGHGWYDGTNGWDGRPHRTGTNRDYFQWHALPTRLPIHLRANAVFTNRVAATCCSSVRFQWTRRRGFSQNVIRAVCIFRFDRGSENAHVFLHFSRQKKKTICGVRFVHEFNDVIYFRHFSYEHTLWTYFDCAQRFYHINSANAYWRELCSWPCYT